MTQIVNLRTGQPTPDVLVRTVTLSLRQLMADDPIALFELVEICRDPAHEPFGLTGPHLRAMGMLGSDGRVHDATREIVLASVEGDGFDLRLVNPVAG